MRSDAMKQAQRRYYEKIKNTTHFQAKQKEYRQKNNIKYQTDDEYKEKRNLYNKMYYRLNKSKSGKFDYLKNNTIIYND